ncbi:MAG: hypothetical protein EOO95_02270 [Pedobacter sp.]|nr:MAG: hypothetical protein EOO95_02270 [Pedobacter sp.]
MFDSFYPFYCVGYKKSELKGEIIGIRYFSFKTASFRYIVEVEYYPNDFHVIQYYTTKYKNHPKKFQIMTHEFKCRKIIGTCVKIMYGVWMKNPIASFGFVGANTYDPITKKEEPIDNTKRWRVYTHAMENYFGTNTFKHGFQSHNSSYSLLNKKNDVEKLDKEVNELFARLYEKH